MAIDVINQAAQQAPDTQLQQQTTQGWQEQQQSNGVVTTPNVQVDNTTAQIDVQQSDMSVSDVNSVVDESIPQTEVQQNMDSSKLGWQLLSVIDEYLSTVDPALLQEAKRQLEAEKQWTNEAPQEQQEEQKEEQPGTEIPQTTELTEDVGSLKTQWNNEKNTFIRENAQLKQKVLELEVLNEDSVSKIKEWGKELQELKLKWVVLDTVEKSLFETRRLAKENPENEYYIHAYADLMKKELETYWGLNLDGVQQQYYNKKALSWINRPVTETQKQEIKKDTLREVIQKTTKII